MKVVFVTGSHPRHAYIARALAATGKLSGLVIEQREEHVPQAPETLSDELKQLFNLHFANRAKAEQCFFSQNTFPDVPVLNVTHATLNSEKTCRFLSQQAPDLLLSYGCHMLTEQTLSTVSGKKWNIHGGLSPWYRGGVTHFWPSYMLEPQMTGMTVHELTQQLDAGDVIHQCVSELVRGDGIHDLAARSVVQIAKELPTLVAIAEQGKLKTPVANKNAGKLWMGHDWRPEHLRLIYQLYQDKIVDDYLDGKFIQTEPNLIRQFE